LRVDFDRRLRLEFDGSRITSDAGIPAHRELAAMCAVLDRSGLDRRAASTSQMGRFETAWLSGDANLAALADLSGAWIDQVHARRPQTTIVLDMDSSVSETLGAQEGSAYNGHFGCTCYPATTRCSCSTSSAIWNGVRCGPAMRTAPTVGETCCAGAVSAHDAAPLLPG
jgi:hypothetical protein